MNSQELPHNAKDIIQKVLAQVLQDTLIEWYGLDLPPIVSVLPPNLPTWTVHERLVDSVFLTEDGDLLHLEFQSTAIASLDRFAQYALALAVHHHRPVHTVVIYLHPVHNAPTVHDYGSVKITVHNVFITDKDARAAWDRLTHTPSERWTKYDDLDLAFLPFMTDPTTSAEDRARRAVQMLGKLPQEHRRYAAALIAGMTSEFLSPDVLIFLKEVMRMSELIRQLEAEAIERGLQTGYEQGLEKGLEQGLNQGLNQGLSQGRMMGYREAALQILEVRFGPINAMTKTQLDAMAPQELLGAIPQMLAAHSIEEFFLTLPRKS